MYPRDKKENHKLKLEHAGSCLVGTRRENQDAILVRVPDDANELTHKGVVACIADGVSCSEHSQKASHTAVVQFINDYYATPDSWSIKNSASKILTSLNSWLYEEGTKQGLSHNGLVTTFSSIIIKSNTAHIFHVGDTRIYRMRDNKLRLLTKDHQRTNFGKNAYLTRALGMDRMLEVDYQSMSLQEGDRFILTSDGVHDFIDDSALSDFTLNANQLKPQELSEEICHQAMNNGSQDNLSCLIMDITQLPAHSLLEHQQRILTRTIPPALQPTNSLDGYVVEKILYEGSRSHVYQVKEPGTDRRMVMKAPSAHYADDTEYLINFANEAWIGAQLNSHRVMKTYPIANDSKFAYQLCEFINGITLRQWIYDNPQPDLQSVRAILEELVKAVRVFQRAGMVHRDLKPENVMITQEGTVKIIDFGAAKVEGLEEITEESRGGVPLGAVNYIAPEYIANGETSIQSDLFSIAVIGFEMLTGKLPYKPAKSQNLQAARHVKWVYQSILNYREDIPTWIDLAFKKAVHHQPKQRYLALGEFITDLYTPNKGLQNELKESPLMHRDPILFWKSIALLATFIALIELLLLI
ncbi:protein kinase [Vibrio sp. HN007]|uniref:protein kinase domain-containing protein n=1 Tax=Vibrio iocasae TaxID=3098914 RepID=UPI0035D407F3